MYIPKFHWTVKRPISVTPPISKFYSICARVSLHFRLFFRCRSGISIYFIFRPIVLICLNNWKHFIDGRFMKHDPGGRHTTGNHSRTGVIWAIFSWSQSFHLFYVGISVLNFKIHVIKQWWLFKILRRLRHKHNDDP